MQQRHSHWQRRQGEADAPQQEATAASAAPFGPGPDPTATMSWAEILGSWYRLVPGPAQPRFVGGLSVTDKAAPMVFRGEELDASEVRSLWWRTAGVLLGLWLLSYLRPA